ncbi:MAG: hypothetical protein CMH83_02420 [Nocardioides sp.]|nr:hypothetical protein [Nocardioides sp.]
MATHWTIGCDAIGPRRLATFWCAALGYVREPGSDEPDCASIIDPDGVVAAIGWLRVPEFEAARNRVHLDVRVTRNAPDEPTVRGGAALGHVVMLDLEGNEFCVA